MKNAVRIIAAVLDTSTLTLYKENGETILIPQGDPRVRRIVDEATMQIVNQGYADVDIAKETDTTYSDFEEQSNGVVKLFRIAKNKLAALFSGKSEDAPLTSAVIGKPPLATQATLNALKEIMQHAIPVSSPQFTEQGIDEQGDVVEETGHTLSGTADGNATDTIIAVVDDKIIPGMEKIKTQFSRATKLGSTEGMEAFLRRLGNVINERSHSVDDLLKFMERGDLPIANDGSILIYKVLNRNGSKFTDCHTGKVEQWVGAYVCMDTSLVDHNRNNECSNGLHVARRGYVRQFHGHACVLAKLAPEDVIAVPSYDANKMRVCGYHIIAELSPDQFTLVKGNRPITDDPAGKILLGKALEGAHIGRTHEVRITEQSGGGVVVTELVKVPVAKSKPKAFEAEALDNPVKELKDTPVNPKDVVKQIEQLSRKDRAMQLYAAGDIEGLKALKKATKLSWEKLGVPDPDIAPPPVVKKPAVDTKRAVNGVMLGEGSAKERIHKLLAIGLTSVGVAQAVLALKKQSKKSWDVLGVSSTHVQDIQKLTNSLKE